MDKFPIEGQRTELERDGGFTLIELLIVCLILPIVVGAITMGMLAVLNLNGSVSTRLSGSGDAQVLASYFVGDVQSATTVTTSQSALLCGTQGTQVLGITDSNNQTKLSYALVPSTDSANYKVFRYLCKTDGTSLSSTVVSHDAGAVSGGVPAGIVVITCSTSCDASTPLDVPNVTVTGVTMTIKTSVDKYNKTYTYSVTAVPRLGAWNASGNTTTAAPPPLLLLGSGSSVLSCPNGLTSVTGAVGINSTASPSVHPIELKGQASVSATQGYFVQGDPTQSTSKSNNSTITGTSYQGGPFSDPYATILNAWTPPTVPVITSTPTGTASPGVYTSTFKLSGGSMVLNPGIYVFKNGIRLSGGASLTSAPGGVFIYVPTGGSVDLSGGGNINLQPYMDPASPYPQMVLWAQDPSALTLSGNGSSTTIGGIIYAPSSAVNGNGNGTLIAGALVASTIQCSSGNGQIKIVGIS